MVISLGERGSDHFAVVAPLLAFCLGGKSEWMSRCGGVGGGVFIETYHEYILAVESDRGW